MILSFTHSSDFASGGDMRAEHWNEPIRQIERLFQSRFSSDNFSNGSIRNSAFRRRGLTEVFRRRNSGDVYTVFPGADPDTVEIPGGAIRFRLRAHADVMVFFTATILRLNHWDKSLDPLIDLNNGVYPYWFGELGFQAHWEGEDKEPGREYVQAQAYMDKKGIYVDKVNMSGCVFFAYRIRARDVGLNDLLFAGDFNDNILMSRGYDIVKDRNVSDLRMVATGTSTGPLLQPTNFERLLPGWHNLRHTVQYTNRDHYATSEVAIGGMEGNDPPVMRRPTQEPLVFGNTELVVVADYGPRGDSMKEIPEGEPMDPKTLQPKPDFPRPEIPEGGGPFYGDDFG